MEVKMSADLYMQTKSLDGRVFGALPLYLGM
jgi:hypothetical protein